MKNEKMVVEDQDRDNKTHPLSYRVIIISLITIVLCMITMMRSKWLKTGTYLEFSSFPSPAGLAPVILLLLAGAFARRLKFSSGELRVMYTLTSFGTLLFSALYYFVPAIASPRMFGVAYSTPLEGKVSLLYALDHVSNLVVPFGDIDPVGLWYRGSEAVPWSAWFVPYFVVLGLNLIFLAVLLSASTLVYRHWTEVQHFRFPLMQPIIEITDTENRKSLWKNKLFLIGMLYPLIFYSLALLNNYYPYIPKLDERKILYTTAQFKEGILPFGMSTRAAESLYRIYPSMVFGPLMYGIYYLLDLDIAFTTWFWWLFGIGGSFLTLGYMADSGVNMPTQFNFRFMETGIFLSLPALAVISLWYARDDIKVMIAKTFKRDASVDDEYAPVSYKRAIYTIIFGTLFIAIACSILYKMSFIFLLIYFVLGLLGAIGVSRIRCEAGYPGNSGMYAGVYKYGGAMIGLEHNSMFSVFVGPFSYFYRGITPTMGLTIEGVAMAKASKIDHKKIVSIMMGIAVIVGVLWLFMSLPIFYKVGGVNAMTTAEFWPNDSYWAIEMSNRAHLRGWKYVTDGYGHPAYLLSALGLAGLVFLTSWLRARFIWFPVHPSVIAFGNMGFANYHSVAFIVWAVKGLMYRYGGVSLVKDLKPVAIGLIVGSVLMQILTAIIQGIIPVM